MQGAAGAAQFHPSSSQALRQRQPYGAKLHRRIITALPQTLIRLVIPLLLSWSCSAVLVLRPSTPFLPSTYLSEPCFSD
jgi:hypothetical protein